MKIYFSPISLIKLEAIFKKYIEINEDFDLLDIDNLLSAMYIFISNHYEAMNKDILNSINAKFNSEKNEVFITDSCINEISQNHNIAPEVINKLLKVALQYSISKNEYEISEEETNDIKKINIKLKKSKIDKSEYCLDLPFEEEICLNFCIEKLCYQDAISLHFLYQKSIKTLSVLNQELLILLLKTLKDDKMQSLSENDILTIFKGNLSLLYKIIVICINFSYKNQISKKVIFSPIM